MDNKQACAFLAVVGACLAPGLAQDHLHWLPGEAPPGIVGSITRAIAWDRDGAGPLGEVLLCAGTFTVPSIGVENLAWFDPTDSTWHGFGATFDGTIWSVAAMPNGDLWVGGYFSVIDGVAAHCLAVWNGTSWTSPGGGVAPYGSGGAGYPYPGTVLAIQPLPNGEVAIGGYFTSAGGVTTGGLARWDGSGWHAYPGFAVSYHTERLALRPNGNLVVLGMFPASIAEWNGIGWATLGNGLVGGNSRGLVVLPGGDVIVAGGYATAGVPLHGMARWNGVGWSDFAPQFLAPPRCLLLQANGDLLAGSVASVAGALDGVARWDGTQWLPFSPPTSSEILREVNGVLFGCGTNEGWVSTGFAGVARWDGSAWQPITHGVDNTVRSLLTLAGGDLVAVGEFHFLASGLVRYLAQRHAGVWTPIPAINLPSAPGMIACVDEVGDLWGVQTLVGRWDGMAWQTIPLPMGPGEVACIVVRNQKPILGFSDYPPGGYSVATVHRWTGAAWDPIGQGLDGPVLALQPLANGDVVAGGDFLYFGSQWRSRIARWNGTTWQPFGLGLDGTVRVLAELPDGTLVAGGDFVNDGSLVRPLGFVAYWDGTDWQPFGSGLAGPPGASVRALQVLPNGDLIAAGDFTSAGGQPADGVALWDGAAWHALDGGLDGRVLTIAQGPDGDLCFGGDFTRAGSSAHFAQLRSDAPALAQPYGTACAGTAGPLALHATALPWLGSTCRTRCVTVSSAAFGVVVLGLAPLQVPLANLFPVAGPGCTLLSTLDLLTLQLPVAGAIEASFAVPDAPALLGATLQQQVLVGELAPTTLALVHVAASDALTLTLGAF